MAAAGAVYYSAVDLAALDFDPMTKEGKLYVAALSPPLVVQTPPVALASALAEDEAAPFAYLAPTGGFARFLRDAEARILDRCVEHKAAWFRKDIDDEALRHNFKSFFRDSDFKVKVTGELVVFDADKNLVGREEAVEGRHARCILELVRVCFGRQEFGAMWRLVQAQLVEAPACLIDDAAEAEHEEAGEGGQEGDAIDEQEFL